MATGSRTDPYRGFNFMVEIDGITQAGFQEVSGLDASTDSVDYREGTDPNHVRKLPGLNKYYADHTQAWHYRFRRVVEVAADGDRWQNRAQERLDRPA